MPKSRLQKDIFMISAGSDPLLRNREEPFDLTRRRQATVPPTLGQAAHFHKQIVAPGSGGSRLGPGDTAPKSCPGPQNFQGNYGT